MAKYSFAQLEQLWKQAGGNAVYAAMAAAIAMAESGGNSTATHTNSNGTTDRGLWQINSIHGKQSTTNAAENARAAVAISKNGTDWRPWCTAWSTGKCSGTFMGSTSPVFKYLPAGSPTGIQALGSAAIGIATNTPAVKAIAAAKTELGHPYKFGAEGQGGAFDCSGLVQWAYKQAGITLPRTAAEQQANTTPVSKANAAPGDLVFYGNPATHVGIYLGSGMYIEAPHTGAVIKITGVGDNVHNFGRVKGSGAGTGATVQTTGLDIPNPFPGNPLGGILSGVLGDPSKILDPGYWFKQALLPALKVVWYIVETAGGAVIMLLGVVLLAQQSSTVRNAEALAVPGGKAVKTTASLLGASKGSRKPVETGSGDSGTESTSPPSVPPAPSERATRRNPDSVSDELAAKRRARRLAREGEQKRRAQ